MFNNELMWPCIQEINGLGPAIGVLEVTLIVEKSYPSKNEAHETPVPLLIYTSDVGGR